MKKLIIIAGVLFSTLLLSDAIGQTFPNEMRFYVPNPHYNEDVGRAYVPSFIPGCYNYVYPSRLANSYPIHPGNMIKIELLNGSGVSYQWYLYIMGIEIAITGQTSATLNHRLDYDAQNYTMVYKCIVTSSTEQKTYQASFYVKGLLPGTVKAMNSLEELTNGEANAVNNASNVNKLGIVKMFPNPANEIIHVELNGVTTSSDVVRVSVLDEKTGTQVKPQQDINEKNFEMNVSTLPQGKYILTVEKDGAKDFKRLYINR